jgi:hypothetical protein
VECAGESRFLIGGERRVALAFHAKVTTNLPAVSKRDVEVVRTAGWGDEAIYFAITTAGSTPPGVPEMSEEAHRRLAEHDYVREERK